MFDVKLRRYRFILIRYSAMMRTLTESKRWIVFIFINLEKVFDSVEIWSVSNSLKGRRVSNFMRQRRNFMIGRTEVIHINPGECLKKISLK